MEAQACAPAAGGVQVDGNGTRKRATFRVVPEEGKKRVNYSKGNARRIMEEAVSLCEAMGLGYEVVLHGRRRSSTALKIGGSAGCVSSGRAGEQDDKRRNEDCDLDDSEVAYIARSKRDVAEHFGVAWSTMQPRLVGKIGAKPAPPSRRIGLPDDLEADLYSHVVWMCEKGFHMSWDSIREVAWQLGKIRHVQDFAATAQWLKKFKNRFPDLAARYSPQLRNHHNPKRGPGDPGYGEASGDERNGADIGAMWGDIGMGVSGGLSMASAIQNDMQASTVSDYLAGLRARAESEAENMRRQQQAGPLSGLGALAGAHQDGRRHLPHSSLIGGVSPHVLAHGYNSGQLQMPSHYHPSLLEPSVRMPPVWGHGSSNIILGGSGHEELLQQQQQEQQHQQHLGLSLQQIGQAGVGLQGMIGTAGGAAGIDGSGTHHHGIGGQTQPVPRSQTLFQMAHFPTMATPNMMMNLSTAGLAPPCSTSAAGVVMLPSGNGSATRRMLPSSQGAAIGMPGSWQAQAAWPDPLTGSWHQQKQQQQQQQLQMLPSQGSFQGYPSSLDPEEGGSLTVPPSALGREDLGHRHPHDFEVPSAPNASAGQALGLGLGFGGQQQTQDEAHVLGPADAIGMGLQRVSSPLELRRPKREDVSEGDASRPTRALRGRVGDGRPSAGQHEQGPSTQWSRGGAGGFPRSVESQPSSGGGSGGDSEGRGEGSDVVSENGGHPTSSFLPGMCAPAPDSPKSALVTYGVHLGMRGPDDGDVNDTAAPCASVPVLRNGSLAGGLARDVVHGSGAKRGDGGDVAHGSHDSSGVTEAFRFGDAVGDRLRPDFGKAKRRGKFNGVASGGGRVSDGGNDRGDEYEHDRVH